MAETSKLENFLTALFGDDFDAKATAEKLKAKYAKERQEGLQQALLIMREHNVTNADIPHRMFVIVAAHALMKQLNSVTTDLQMIDKLISMDPNAKIPDTVLENIRLFIHSVPCYEQICNHFQEESVFTDIQKEQIEKVLAKAKELCPQDQQAFSLKDVHIFADMLYEYQIRTFCSKDIHTIKDAAKIIAAYTDRHILLHSEKPYNVLAAEKRIADLQRYTHYKSFAELPHELLMATIPTIARNNLELFDATAKEIDDLLNRTEKTFGYKLNYIKSGKQAFNVFTWNGEIDDNQENEQYPKGTIWAEDKGDFPTLEEAQSIAEEGDEIEEYDPEEMWAIVDPNGNNPTNMIYPYKERAAVFLIGILGKNKLPNWYAWEELLNSEERS